MITSNSSEAYNLSLYQDQNKNKKAQIYDFALFEAPRKKTKCFQPEKSKQRHELISLQKKLCAVILSALIMLTGSSAMLASKAKNDQMQQKISSMKTNIESAKSENIRLLNAISSSVSPKNVEIYATEEMEMRKIDRQNITYINTSLGDGVVFYEQRHPFIQNILKGE